MMKTTQRQRESGATAIFIVVFAAILLLVITLGFMRTMIHEQTRSTDSVLSQSAYDAALAGVEDGKRVIKLCQNGATITCDQISQSQSRCDLANRALSIGSDSEVLLKSSTASDVTSATYDQAYTCLRINPAPGNYSADIFRDQPLVIPLSVDSPASTLEISWQKKDAALTEELNIDASDASTGNLYDLPSWVDKNKPPMLRVQLIRSVNSTSSDTGVQFLYPSNLTSATGDFAENRKTPLQAACLATGGFIGQVMAGDQKCRVTLKDGGSQITEGQKYLVITPLYADASVTLTLPEGSHFVGIQNVVDSTGRANNVFRRVSARVDLIPHTTYPNAAVTLSGPLCKNFMVTPNSYASGTSAPSCAE